MVSVARPSDNGGLTQSVRQRRGGVVVNELSENGKKDRLARAVVC